MKISKLLLMSSFGVAALGAAGVARAATPEYVIILLDQTGSMCNDDPTCTAGVDSTGQPMPMPWDNALSDAKLWITADSADATATQRFYAIYTFKDTQDGAQNTSLQIWPTPGLANGVACTGIPTGTLATNLGTVDAASGFCKLALDSRAYSNPAGTSGIAGVVESLRRLSGQVPQPTWLTPLADGVCRGLSRVWLSNQTNNRTLILESDGGENDSNQVAKTCFGGASTTTINNITDLQNAKKAANSQDWGFTVGSWEANIMRRGARVGTPIGGLTVDNWEAAAAVNGAPLTGAETFPTQLTMKVSVNYTTCVPSDTDPICVLNAGTLPAQSLRAAPLALAASAGMKTDGVKPSQTTQLAFAALAAAPVTAAATQTRVPTLDAHQLGFFRALGKITPKSQLREVVRDPGVVFGVTHKIAGDVDDSGCTDHADFSIVTQKDVWMQRAVLPLQIAIRADLNRDGWVDELDRAIVIANWGKGCINSAGPPPKLQ